MSGPPGNHKLRRLGRCQAEEGRTSGREGRTFGGEGRMSGGRNECAEEKKKGRTSAREGSIHKVGLADVEGCGG